MLDPARGQGAFYDGFPPHLDRRWCEIAESRDFLIWHQPVDWVMTNPPWSRLRDLDETGFGIAELVRIDTPNDCPQSGFQFVAAWLRRGHAGGWAVTRLGG